MTTNHVKNGKPAEVASSKYVAAVGEEDAVELKTLKNHRLCQSSFMGSRRPSGKMPPPNLRRRSYTQLYAVTLNVRDDEANKMTACHSSARRAGPLLLQQEVFIRQIIYDRPV